MGRLVNQILKALSFFAQIQSSKQKCKQKEERKEKKRGDEKVNLATDSLIASRCFQEVQFLISQLFQVQAICHVGTLCHRSCTLGRDFIGEVFHIGF